MKNPPANSAGGEGKRKDATLALHKKQEVAGGGHPDQSAREGRTCQCRGDQRPGRPYIL